MPSPLDRLKTSLSPDYSLEQEIGNTAWATTYLACDQEGNKVVMSVLHTKVAAEIDTGRFPDAMLRSKELSCSRLVAPCDAGVTDGTPYYVTPLTEGVTVRDKLDVHGPAPFGEVVRIILQVAEGLARMHERGIPHLAVTPEHVLLQGREATLTDVCVGFAISGALTEPTGLMPDLQKAYIAPECASGTHLGDHLSDIYQLGVLGYELLTGRTPPTSDITVGVPTTTDVQTVEILSHQRADTPPALARLVARCLATKPADRWQNVTEVLSALDTSIPPRLETTAPTGDAVETIGPYHIRGVLGKGGMGMVYLAEQTAPVKRPVALKVIKLGMDTKEVLARFYSERQALAMMDHPNIARVLDASTTPTGRPYFAMELVSGVSLTEYCDHEKLSTRDRLELFMQVCQAIHHAHQKGIIHRDIKPPNILVTQQDGQPVPKVIDFGLAKALGHELTDRTLETRDDQLLGTPAYMSPEQAGVTALEVDTRTDVYSLGAVLYEVLTGAVPFDPDALSGEGTDVRDAIRHSDPPTPSARFWSLAASRQPIAACRATNPEALRRQLTGDLDWVTMKAMAKDRAGRYETVNELGRDIERHLRLEPVEARAPSVTYRFGRFIRRHKAGAAATLVAVVALVLGLVVTTTLMIRATRAERLAAIEAETAQRVSQFLEGLFEVSDPSESRGNTVTAREILDRGAEEINSGLEGQPLVQSRLMMTLGTVYSSLGLYDEAATMLNRSLDIRRENLGDNHLDVASSLSALGGVYERQGRYAEAESLVRRALTIREESLAPTDTLLGVTLSLLAFITGPRQGKFAEAESLATRALDIQEKAFGSDHQEVAISLQTLATIHSFQGRYDEAEMLEGRVLEIEERTLGTEHPRVAITLLRLARIYWGQKRYADQEDVLKRAVTIQEATLGPDHPNLGYTLNGLALVLMEQGMYAEAEHYYGRVLDIWERAHGPESPMLVPLLINLGALYERQELYADVESVHRRSLAIKRANGPDDGDVAVNLLEIGRTYVRQARYEEAIPLLQRSATIFETTGGLYLNRFTESPSVLAEAYTHLGQYAEAQAAHQRRIAVVEEALGSNHPNLAIALESYATLLRTLGREDKADSLKARADSIRAGAG